MHGPPVVQRVLRQLLHRHRLIEERIRFVADSADSYSHVTNSAMALFSPSTFAVKAGYRVAATLMESGSLKPWPVTRHTTVSPGFTQPARSERPSPARAAAPAGSV